MSKLFEGRGFTLTEVLIGLLILAVGILAIAGMQITSIRGTSFSSHLTQASMLAQNRLEFFKSLPIDHAMLDSGDYLNDLKQGIFEGQYKAERAGDYVTLRYTITWSEDGNSRRVSFSTIKSR